MTRDQGPNQALAAAIAEAGCTYSALAREVRLVAAEAGATLRTVPAGVHYWVTGGTPARETAIYLAEALTRKTKRRVTTAEIGLGCDAIEAGPAADPLAAAADYGRYVVLHRRDFLASAFAATAVGLPAYDHHAVAAPLKVAQSGGRAGAAEVMVVRQMTAQFRSADDRLGGGHGLATAAVYLGDTVVPMLQASFPTATLRQDAYGAAAELACLLGFKLHDLGREGAAQHYYNVAFQLAVESGSAGRAAWMMRARTHQALDLGHPQHCVDLAEAALAQAKGQVDRKTEALLLVTAARAYGASGRTREAASALLAAEDAVNATDDDVPAYSAASGPVTATVASHTAKTLTEMREHQAAERHYRIALEGRTPDTYQRVHGLTLANVAKAVAAQHRHEEAVSLWNRSLDFMDGVASERNRKELTTVRTTMANWSRRGINGAADLDQRAAGLARAQNLAPRGLDS